MTQLTWNNEWPRHLKVAPFFIQSQVDILKKKIENKRLIIVNILNVQFIRRQDTTWNSYQYLFENLFIKKEQ